MSHTPFTTRRRAAALLVAAIAMPAWSQNQGLNAPGTAFDSACAGLIFGLSSTPMGYPLNNNAPGANLSCGGHSTPWPALTSVAVAQQGTSNNVHFDASASAHAAPQVIDLRANTQASTATNFAGGVAAAGWNDRFTLTAAGQSGTALWELPLQVDGALNVTGIGGLAVLNLMAYRNHAPMQPYGSALNAAAWAQFQAEQPMHTGVTGGSWDSQMVEWAAGDTGPGGVNNLPSIPINGVVRFVVPFTWGQPFDVGIYAMVTAWQSSSTGATSTSDTAQADFSPGIRWAGPGQVLVNGQAVGVFGISADSGIDYSRAYSPAVPEPAGPLLWLTGLPLLAWARARRHAAARRAAA